MPINSRAFGIKVSRSNENDGENESVSQGASQMRLDPESNIQNQEDNHTTEQVHRTVPSILVYKTTNYYM